MLCITDAYGVKQAHTSLLTISFLAVLQYVLYPHLSRIRQTFEAAGKVVQTGKHPESVSCQSHCLGPAKLEDGSMIKHCLHLQIWKADHLTCCFKPSNIGGIFSTVLPPLANKIFLATLVLHALIAELCRLTKNCSRV